MFGYKLIRESEYEAIKQSILDDSQQNRIMFDSYMAQSKALGFLFQKIPEVRAVYNDCFNFVIQQHKLKTGS